MRGGGTIVAIAICIAGCGLLADCGEYGDSTVPPSDASIGDGSAPPSDAPITVTDAGDGSSMVGCAARTAKLCDDFDKGIASFWDLIENGATADDTASISPPRSLLVSLAPNSERFQRIVLDKSLPVAKRIRVEATMRVDAYGGASFASFLKIAIVPPPAGYATYYIALSSGATVYSIQEYTEPTDGGLVNGATSFDAPWDTWKRIGIELDLENSNASVFVDGLRVVKRSVQTAGPANAPSEVQVGLPYMDTAAGPWKVRMDDVTIDYE